MARKRKRIPRNMGRIEFIACQDVIDAMRVQGYDNKKIHAALVKKGKVTMSYATSSEQAAKDAKEKLWRTAVAGGQDMDLSKLHFGYGLKGRAAWKPTKVYDDGRQTFIRLPDSTATGEMPILLVRKASGNVLVNYRVKERTMVMDGLFDRVLFIVGVGSDQEKIEITREKS